MKRSSVQPSSDEGKRSLFESMMAFSEHPWHILDSGAWSQGTVEPTREEHIESEMLISRTVCEKGVNKKGEHEPHYPTRAEAEAEVDRWLSRNRPEATSTAA